jgi:hypothetical protein
MSPTWIHGARERQSSAMNEAGVLIVADGHGAALGDLASRFGLRVDRIEAGAPIPGSYWGAPEAGLVGSRLLVRADTPLHSALHETCHYVCMTEERRRSLHGDAESDDLEESAVCYLQVVLSDYISGFGRERMFRDMDTWGYSFRLGSSRAWFEQDAEDARLWLQRHGLLDEDARPRWRLRS